MKQNSLHTAYQYCESVARGHYENFPVASRLLPGAIRPAVTVIYTFARNADDFADEDDLPAAVRIEKLDDYVQQLDALQQGQTPEQAVFIALDDVIKKHNLPWEPFYDLLSAFRQDVTKTRYANFGEVMDYCRRSANPVGRLLLHLYNQATPHNIGYSDAICSALQLINFLQDVHQDINENDRIYIPQDEMERFKVSEQQLRDKHAVFNTQHLMQMQIQRARQLLQSGAPLGKVLKGRIGFEMRLIIMGGSRILQKLHKQLDQPFSRPRLNTRDKLWMLWRALIPR